MAGAHFGTSQVTFTRPQNMNGTHRPDRGHAHPPASRAALALLMLIAGCSSADSSTAPAPETGGITVTMSTSGSSPDQNGYTLTVDGTHTQSLLITTGSPLDTQGDIEQAYIQGRELDMMDIQKWFFEKYMEKLNQRMRVIS